MITYTYTAFGLVMSRKSFVSGCNLTYDAFGSEQLRRRTMSFSPSARFSIIGESERARACQIHSGPIDSVPDRARQFPNHAYASDTHFCLDNKLARRTLFVLSGEIHVISIGVDVEPMHEWPGGENITCSASRIRGLWSLLSSTGGKGRRIAERTQLGR